MIKNNLSKAALTVAIVEISPLSSDADCETKFNEVLEDLLKSPLSVWKVKMVSVCLINAT